MCTACATLTDLTYLDFLQSAAAVTPVLNLASQCGVGKTVLEAVQATRTVAPTNTNLGIVLLLAPLAAVPPSEDLRQGLLRVLDNLNVADARAVYEAIRLAAAGGLGRVAEQDIARGTNTKPTRGHGVGGGARSHRSAICERLP